MSGICSLFCCLSLLIVGIQATPISECEAVVSSASMLQADVVRDRTTTKDVKIDMMKSSSFTEEQIRKLLAKLRGKLTSSHVAEMFADDACMLIIGAPSTPGTENETSGASQICGQDALLAFFHKFEGDTDKITTTAIVSQSTVFVRDCDANHIASDNLVTLDSNVKITHMTSSNFGSC